MKKKFVMVKILIFTFAVYIIKVFEVFAADISDPNELGSIVHYNGLIFNYFESYGADIEGALAVGGESAIGTSGQFDIGAAAAPEYGTVAIGEYENPDGYPTLMLNGLPAVGSAVKNNVHVYGGSLVLNEDLQAAYTNQTNQISAVPKYAESQIINEFFSNAYNTVKNTVQVFANAQQNADAAVSVSDFTGYSVYSGFQTNLSDFEPDNLSTGGTGIASDDVLVINITDAGHVSINSPQITSAFGNYELIIFNFPKAASVDFNGGSVTVDGTQINTSAPAFWLPEANALLTKYAEKIIWNFPEAKSVQVYASGVVGSILAPDAYVDATGGSINGMLMADTLIMTGSHELHAFRMSDIIFDFTNNTDPLLGCVILYKVDADDNGIYLQDAIFQLQVWNAGISSWESYSAETDSLVTNRYGRIKIEALPEGQYRLAEISPPDGYDLPSGDDSYHEFTINENNGIETAVKIIAEDTKPTISISIQKLDESNPTESLENAQFSLYRLEEDGDVVLIRSDIVTGANGQTTVSELTAGTYYLMEYAPPTGYELNMLYLAIRIVVTQDNTIGNLQTSFFLTDGSEIFPNQNGDLEIFNAALSDSHLILAKTDADDGSRLSGARFRLDIYNIDTNEWEEYNGSEISENPIETDEYGYLVIEGLPDGQYRLVEVAPPEGYEFENNEEFEFRISEGVFENGEREYFITAKNTAVEGSLEIRKTDRDTGFALADAGFALYRVKDDNAMIKITDLVTDINGRAAVAGLEQGMYWLEETKVPDGYRMGNPEGWKIVIGDDGVGNFVYDHVVEIENEVVTGSVKLTKADGKTGTLLPNVVFDLYKLDESSNIWSLCLSSLTTDANGQLEEINGLALGTYKFVEVSNPNDGYEPGQGIVFSITSAGTQQLTITMNNYKIQFPALHIYKADYDDQSILLPGARFLLYCSDTGDFDTADAYEVYGTAVSDENGRIAFPELAAGYYRLVEIMAPGDYLIENRELVFEVRQITGAELRIYIDGMDVTDFMAEPRYILNRKKAMEVNLLKVDANDTSVVLEGAKFALYRLQDDGNAALITQQIITDANGQYTIENLKAGTYYLMEYSPPAAYDIDISYFVIKMVISQNENSNLQTQFYQSDGTEIFLNAGGELEILNKESQDPRLVLVKVDADNGSLLSGAVFDLYVWDDSTGDWAHHEGSLTTNEYGYFSIEGLPDGKYKLVESTPPDGYKNTDRTVQFVIIDGVFEGTGGDKDYIITVENSAINVITGNVRLKKVDSDTGDVLAGAVFDIYFSKSGENSTFVKTGTVTSNNDGEIALPELTAGFYRLVETAAPDGYELGASVEFGMQLADGSLAVYYNGRKVSAEGGLKIENTKLTAPDSNGDIPQKPESDADTKDLDADTTNRNKNNPSTGDLNHMTAWYGVLLLISSISAALLIIKRRIN